MLDESPFGVSTPPNAAVAVGVGIITFLTSFVCLFLSLTLKLLGDKKRRNRAWKLGKEGRNYDDDNDDERGGVAKEKKRSRSRGSVCESSECNEVRGTRDRNTMGYLWRDQDPWHCHVKVELPIWDCYVAIIYVQLAAAGEMVHRESVHFLFLVAFSFFFPPVFGFQITKKK